MKYEAPIMEVVKFEGKDVVCASMPGDNTDPYSLDVL